MKLLYICTHNRCRSILSEAITNQFGQGRLEARSAGSQPSGVVHPLSLKYLKAQDIAIDGLHSKSWNNLDGWQPDVVVTVCDSAAGEACPIWLGDTIKVHWGLADPSKLEGSDEEKAAAFNQTIEIIKQRVSTMLELQLDQLRGSALQDALTKLASGEQ
ncbi:arsenate reductase ArsC [Microbulbifer sp. YPW1]|uniref:arsenate reductase ArsC n=1 Tax=Microbulbifer sp. YPW1 TaxID=2745199 RepID=UPI00159AB81E|nr:arsenate reductase ArsC [Microbulbifer sp. YPW1]QKX18254.1 arsenate reductase ArsC [Microbulbifer sp. YPW1]